MTDHYLSWLSMEILQAQRLYSEAEGSRKRNINARLLTLREARNRYLQSKADVPCIHGGNY